jgi:hypothetical protein
MVIKAWPIASGVNAPSPLAGWIFKDQYIKIAAL